MNIPGKPLEEFPHGHKIQLIGTIEDDALYRESLGQILGGLRFSSAGWTCRGPTEFQMKRPGQCQIATIREGGDDEPSAVSKVFIPVLEFCVDSSYF